MFKKFDSDTEVSGISQTKSSVAKAVRGRLLKDYPAIEPYLDDIIPKKEPLNIVKCHEHIELLAAKGELLFFRQRDGPYMPCLRLLHKYQNLLPKLQVDKGAIKFILSGANIMAPGLTSPGARMDIDLPADTVVAIMAEGKQHALCIGITKLSTADIRSVNKGIAVDNIHYLCDGLWAMKLQHR